MLHMSEKVCHCQNTTAAWAPGASTIKCQQNFFSPTTLINDEVYFHKSRCLEITGDPVLLIKHRLQ